MKDGAVSRLTSDDHGRTDERYVGENASVCVVVAKI